MNFSFLKTSKSGAGVSPSARKMPATPAEDLVVKVYFSQIVMVGLPYNSPKAASIRQHAAAFLVDDNNRRVVVFRKDMGGGSCLAD